MVLVVILLPALFALSALAINIAQMESANTEIQVAVDAAVRAAGRTYAVTGDQEEALLAAQEAAARNPIGEFVLPITGADLEFGISDRSNPGDPYTFTPASSGNAVRLTTTTLSTGGAAIPPVFPFFGSSFEIRPLRSAVSTQGVIDISLVIDRSGSMAYHSSEIAEYPPAPMNAPEGWAFGDAVPSGSRWIDLLGAVRTFIGELGVTPTQEQLALSVYNHNAETKQSLSTEYQLVIDELAAISLNFESGGTNIGGGMYKGLSAVNDPSAARQHASKVIVLMTDGVHNYGTDPVSAAYSVANSGVTLFAITFSDEADQSKMQRVAEICGGKHFHAITATQLQQAFRDIAKRLPTLLTK